MGRWAVGGVYIWQAKLWENYMVARPSGGMITYEFGNVRVRFTDR